MFPLKESNCNLRSSTIMKGRSIKSSSCMIQKLYLIWDQKCGHFTNRIKKYSVSYIIQKENS